MALSGSTNPLHAFIMPGYSMGLALYRLKEYKQAEQILLAALDKATQTNLNNDKKEAHATLAAVYEGLGRYKEALQQQRLYEQLKDSQTNTEKLRAINEIEARHQTAQKDKEIIQKGLQIAQQEGRLERKNILIGVVIGTAVLLVLVVLGVWYSRRKISLKDRKIEQLKAMMAGEEKERARISRELHDGIGGMLTGIKMNLKTFQKIHEEQPVSEGLNDIMDMLQDMGQEIHKTAHNLMPDILLKHNLKEALALYCEQLDTGGKLEIDLQFHGAVDELDKSLELPLYRIIQELLQNIIKHANATLVAIQLRRDDDIIRISVEDNGTGFNPAGCKPGLGLLNIETRIQALNGYFSIEPTQKMGTTAFIELDINNMN
jgi:signal transduction histidine kinase